MGNGAGKGIGPHRWIYYSLVWCQVATISIGVFGAIVVLTDDQVLQLITVHCINPNPNALMIRSSNHSTSSSN